MSDLPRQASVTDSAKSRVQHDDASNKLASDPIGEIGVQRSDFRSEQVQTCRPKRARIRATDRYYHSSVRSTMESTKK